MKNTIYEITKNSISSFFILFLGLAFAFSALSSCASIAKVPISNSIKRKDAKPPVDAFAFVLVNQKLIPNKCVKNEKFKMCEEVIGTLPTIDKKSFGSGLLVKGKNRSVVLTAAHVCKLSQGSEGLIYEHSGVQIQIKVSTDIKVRNSKGEVLSTRIVRIDYPNDLCALLPEKVYTKPVSWASKPPSVGDRVYSISAPLGINSPSMNLIFQGFYSGHIKEDIHHYTLPSKPGSSGSIVLDKNFRGVGMINAAYTGMESIGIGAGHKEIKNFLDLL